MTLPFDRVMLIEDGAPREITLADLRSIPLTRRVRLILEDRIEFWMGASRVSNVVALRAIQQAARD